MALPNGHVVILGMGGTGVAQAWAAEGSGSGSEMSPQEKSFMENSALWSQFFFFFFKQKPPLAPTMLLSHCLTLFHPFSGYFYSSFPPILPLLTCHHPKHPSVLFPLVISPP